MSWQNKVMTVALRMGKWYLGRKPYPEIQRLMHKYMDGPAAKQKLPDWVERREEVIAGVACQWVSVDDVKSERLVIYFHGGAFMAGSPATHTDLAWRLARAAGARVLLVDYRLTPEFRFPAPVDDAEAVYKALLTRGEQPAKMAFAGDSAGGNLTLAALQRLRAGHQPLPAAAIVLSPWADLTHSGASIQTHAKLEAMIPVHMLEEAARVYLGDADPRDPEASPVFANFIGMPPLQLHVGAEEVLADDSQRIYEAAIRAGVAAEYRVWPDLPHAFPALAGFVPEARAAIEEMGAFLRRQWAGQR